MGSCCPLAPCLRVLPRLERVSRGRRLRQSLEGAAREQRHHVEGDVCTQRVQRVGTTPELAPIGGSGHEDRVCLGAHPFWLRPEPQGHGALDAAVLGNQGSSYLIPEA